MIFSWSCKIIPKSGIILSRSYIRSYLKFFAGHVHTLTHTHTHTHTHTQYTHVHTHTHTHACTCTHTYLYTTHTHTHTQKKEIWKKMVLPGTLVSISHHDPVQSSPVQSSSPVIVYYQLNSYSPTSVVPLKLVMTTHWWACKYKD